MVTWVRDEHGIYHLRAGWSGMDVKTRCGLSLPPLFGEPKGYHTECRRCTDKEAK